MAVVVATGSVDVDDDGTTVPNATPSRLRSVTSSSPSEFFARTVILRLPCSCVRACARALEEKMDIRTEPTDYDDDNNSRDNDVRSVEVCNGG